MASIRLAVLLARHRSIRQAAAEQGLRPSIVSRRIRALEDKIGVSIFERSSGGVRTTIAGRRFIERAELALADLDYAIRSAGVAGKGVEGKLVIGILSSLTAPVARAALSSFREANPDVDIAIVEGPPGAHLARIRERRLDIAFILGAADIADCDRMHLWNERAYVALPMTHRLAAQSELRWSDLAGEPFVVRRQEPSSSIQDYVSQTLGGMGHEVLITRFDVSRENLMHLVSLGFGIALAGESTTLMSFPGVVFRPLSHDVEPATFSAAWSRANDNPALRRFLTLLRKAANAPVGDRPGREAK